VTSTSWKVHNEKYCLPSKWQHMTSHCMSDIKDNQKGQSGSAPAPPQSRLGSPSDYHHLGPWKNIWEPSTTRMMMQFRKLCTAGCKVIEWISTTTGSLILCSTGRKVWIIVEILYKSDRTCPGTNEFLSGTFVSLYNKCPHGFWYDLHNICICRVFHWCTTIKPANCVVIKKVQHC